MEKSGEGYTISPVAPTENKWIRPKEMKIGPLLPPFESQGHPLGASRRGFKPQKRITVQQHSLSGSKSVHSFNSPSLATGPKGKLSNKPMRHLPGEEGQPNQSIWTSSTRKATKTAEALPEPKGYRAMTSHKGRTVPDTAPLSLHIEGSSVLNADVSAATSALLHLSDCVKEERRLKEQLEMVQDEKLMAFRSVISVFRQYAHNPSIRAHPEVKTIARCAVVTRALVTIVQTFLRSYQSNQILAARKSLMARSSSDYRTATAVFSEVATESLGSEYDRASRSVEDLLDEQEISKLKQLYFDYYDCEVLSIGGSDLSNASDSFGGGDPQEIEDASASSLDPYHSI